MSSSKRTLLVRNALGTTAFVLLLLTGLGGYGLFRFGSIGALVAVLQGRALYVAPARASVGHLKPREHITIPVTVRNLTSSPLKVLGSHSSCGCLAAEGLPVDLGPDEVRTLPVHVTAPAKGPGEFETIVTFYVNVAGEQPQTVLHGHVRPADAGSVSPKSGG